jgi:biopolymer transport protein ExbD
MAELYISGGSHKKKAGVKKSKKLSTRIDLTPMVDLGFLLITFFIFTTSISKPTVMRFIMPKDGPPTDIKKSAVITVMLGKNDLVYYYEGMDPSIMKVCSMKEIRDVLIDKKRRTDTAFFEVIIKPSQDASYKSIAGIMDEMTINAITHYAMVDITRDEYSLIKATEKSNGIR